MSGNKRAQFTRETMITFIRGPLSRTLRMRALPAPTAANFQTPIAAAAFQGTI
jgi:hypothetical protein